MGISALFSRWRIFVWARGGSLTKKEARGWGLHKNSNVFFISLVGCRGGEKALDEKMMVSLGQTRLSGPDFYVAGDRSFRESFKRWTERLSWLSKGQ